MKQKNHLNEAKPHFERSNPGWRPHGADGIGAPALITMAVFLASNIAMRLTKEATHTVTANSPAESEAISPRSVIAANRRYRPTNFELRSHRSILGVFKDK